MSLVHLWWEPELALCGSTEVGHGEPCRGRGTEPGHWPLAGWNDVSCRACGVSLCRACMRIAAERHGYPVSEIPLLTLSRPHVVSV